ncbi:MAG: FAD-binding oxidoreductase [Desulfarculaceae bacterium]|nr:FAD-binding oxidoreductase [Desulfarculaceae bacterium]
MERELELSTRGGETARVSAVELAELAKRLQGRLIAPQDPEYEQARRIWNGMIDKRPGLIARCGGGADVQACVNFARERRIKVAVRSGGHNVAGRAVCDGGLVIDLSQMTSVEVDPEARTATAQGGATLGDLDQATVPHGLAAPVGVVAETGAAGLTLHGGYGWLCRDRGLACDNLLRAELVLADGRLVHASPTQNPDLLWALKGGGGNFGIVTSLTYRLASVPESNLVALVLYPMDQAWPVLEAIGSYMQSAPRELAVLASFWTAPAEEGVPPQALGQDVLWVLGVYHGPPAGAEKAVRPLKEAAEPIADLSHATDWLGVQSLFDGEYPDGRRYYWKAQYLDSLSGEVVEELVAATARRPSSLTSLDLWFLGGAVNEVDPAATAFSQRSKPCLVNLESNWEDPADDQANLDWTRGVFKRLEGMSSGGAYLNFPGMAEEGEETLKAAYQGNLERLRRVKEAYDPGNFFAGNFNITPPR